MAASTPALNGTFAADSSGLASKMNSSGLVKENAGGKSNDTSQKSMGAYDDPSTK